jgi:type I restriction enzyme M protein
MLGAIVGDIVGSRFEFNNHRSKNFELFTANCFATDDSIMTLAIAKAIMEARKSNANLGDAAVKYMREIGQKYPGCGYGGNFFHWMFSADPQPYNSFGNGAAMRISPAGFAAKSEQEAIETAKALTEVTHNHPEGIKGAVAISKAIFLARQGAAKSEIKSEIERDFYPLNFTIDEIRKTYEFNETCQETVPQAIKCFLESESFEDALRIAVSLGGDTDTVCAITGSIAEAHYGIEDSIKEKALSCLDDCLLSIYKEWVSFIGVFQST